MFFFKFWESFYRLPHVNWICYKTWSNVVDLLCSDSKKSRIIPCNHLYYAVPTITLCCFYHLYIAVLILYFIRLAYMYSAYLYQNCRNWFLLHFLSTSNRPRTAHWNIFFILNFFASIAITYTVVNSCGKYFVGNILLFLYHLVSAFSPSFYKAPPLAFLP